MPATYLSNEQVTEVAESVCSTMLNLPVRPCVQPAADWGSFQVAGTVHITGQWNGTVLLLCSEPFGRRAASAMLDVPEDSATLADIHDAVAELTNIVGGGIKSLLPGPSALSMPTVTQGSDFHLHVHWTQPVGHADLVNDEEPLQVRVLEAIIDLPAAAENVSMPQG